MSTKPKRFVKVGAAVFVLNRKGETLFLQRHGSHGEGTWCVPGGHVDPGETPAEGARREAYEETGVRLGKMRFIGVTSDVHKKEKNPEKKYYVTFYFLAKVTSGKARIREPHKCARMGWFKLNKLPRNLFLPTRILLNAGNDGLAYGVDKQFVKRLKRAA
ncbi:ADP-ribose pyrophosphatase [uncultured archaeon]|nr:ADP-ribose pyrophosphatase [uncultured archaeon]